MQEENCYLHSNCRAKRLTTHILRCRLHAEQQAERTRKRTEQDHARVVALPQGAHAHCFMLVFL